MTGFEETLALLLLTTGLSIAARWVRFPAPITYTLGGLGCALIPGFPHFALRPELFFVCFLPPLLFSDGWLMPLREFAKAKRPIFFLATGLVTCTTIVIGFVAHALIPGLPYGMAFALGAVVSPTDAVAVGAITERLKVPTRLSTILNGESLMNDATGLVAFKFALAAVAVGTFSLKSALLSFVLIACGGLLVGLIVGYAVGKLRDLLIRTGNGDPLIELTLSLLTPYAAYLASEPLQVSGVLAVVAAGLYSGWRDPIRMTAESRQTAWAVWETILFWLNGLAFTLLGLQFPHLLKAVDTSYSAAQIFLFIGVLSAAAIAVRIAWFFVAGRLPFLVSGNARRTERPPPWQSLLVGGWAGIRGTVTLAAALSIPDTLPDGRAFPDKDLVVFLAFGLIVVTLLVQGTTLEGMIQRLGLRGDGIAEREEHLARTTAVKAGLGRLRELADHPLGRSEAAALGVVLAEYEERLAELETEGETQAKARTRLAAERKFQFAALEAERRAVDDLWSRNVIMDEVHRPLQMLLDSEESMLRAAAAGDDTLAI